MRNLRDETLANLDSVRVLTSGETRSRIARSGALALPRIPWEGFPYYHTNNGDQFAKAEASGWAEDTFFPISVFFGKPDSGHPAHFADMGVNTYIYVEGGGTLAQVTDHLFAIAQVDQWDESDAGSDERVVGWMICDEPEFAISYSVYTDRVNNTRAFDDGRFLHTNFGPAIFRTHWYSSPIGGGLYQVDGAYNQVDATGADVYWYTSPGACHNAINTSGDCSTVGWNWPGDPCDLAFAQRCASYGWQAGQCSTEFGSLPHVYKPQTVTIETKLPFLGNDAGNTIITYAQIEAAVFSALAHECRGIMYFQHNGFYGGSYPDNPSIDPNTGLAPDSSTYSLVECEVALQEAVAATNAKVIGLAPVLNTQSYIFNFGASNIDTMLKVKDGFAYIFGSMGFEATTGTKTFTLTGSGITGTSVEVVDEARSLTVTGGQFTDSFPNETSHHVYKVAI